VRRNGFGSSSMRIGTLLNFGRMSSKSAMCRGTAEVTLNNRTRRDGVGSLHGVMVRSRFGAPSRSGARPKALHWLGLVATEDTRVGGRVEMEPGSGRADSLAHALRESQSARKRPVRTPEVMHQLKQARLAHHINLIVLNSAPAPVSSSAHEGDVFRVFKEVL
jgi:hypothetical protein